MGILFGNAPSVMLMSLLLLASAQRTSNNLHKDLDIRELARQNKITKQILEAFFHKRLGINRHNVRPPSIHEILPVGNEDRSTRETEDKGENQEQELQDQFDEDDSLQSVESEQIDSFYSEGT